MAAFDGNINRPKITSAGLFNPLAPNVALKLVTAGAVLAAALFFDGDVSIASPTTNGGFSGFSGAVSIGLPTSDARLETGQSFTGAAPVRLAKSIGVFSTYVYATSIKPVTTQGAWAQGWNFDGTAELPLSNSEGAVFGTVVGETYQSFVVNTKTLGAAQYTNYGFNSLWKGPDGFYYGANAAGIFRLTSKRDNGGQISASVISGTSDFNQRVQKYYPDAYLDLRCEGEMEFTLTVDETKRRTYTVDRREGQQGSHTKRRPLAHGIKGRYAQIEVHNVDGADFDLNSVDLIIEPTSRT